HRVVGIDQTSYPEFFPPEIPGDDDHRAGNAGLPAGIEDGTAGATRRFATVGIIEKRCIPDTQGIGVAATGCCRMFPADPGDDTPRLLVGGHRGGMTDKDGTLDLLFMGCRCGNGIVDLCHGVLLPSIVMAPVPGL